MAEAWLDTAAQRVWGAGNARLEFPRSPCAGVALTLPIASRALSGLTTESVEAWAASRGGAIRLRCARRGLHGAIVAQRGQGILFVSADDPPDEQRFTAAHEIAHFLLDYLLPREKALAALGEAIRPVLDGYQQPTPQQRISAVLADTPLGLYMDLMARDEAGQVAEGRIAFAESRADVLALHLLAPWNEVNTCLPRAPTETNRAHWTRETQGLLVSHFGLPDLVAGEYALHLWHRHQQPDSHAWLGL